MPDISMCRNVECPKRSNCYRYLAHPNRFQSYFMENPDAGNCEHFWGVDHNRYVRDVEHVDSIHKEEAKHG